MYCLNILLMSEVQPKVNQVYSAQKGIELSCVPNLGNNLWVWSFIQTKEKNVSKIWGKILKGWHIWIVNLCLKDEGQCFYLFFPQCGNKEKILINIISYNFWLFVLLLQWRAGIVRLNRITTFATSVKLWSLFNSSWTYLWKWGWWYLP